MGSSVSLQEPLLCLREVPWALFACEFFPCAYDINKSSLDPISQGCGISWLAFGFAQRRETPNWPGAVGTQHPASRRKAVRLYPLTTL